MSIAPDWNNKQKRLREIIKDPALFDEARCLYIELHRLVHCSEMGCVSTYMDRVWEGIQPEHLSVMPTAKDVTIAWNIWHITRIEDLTSNILINQSQQLLNDQWLRKLGTSVTDTGNAMTDEEILAFSKGIDMQVLREYRNAVGQNTQRILWALTADDMKRKVSRTDLDRIHAEGGVTSHADSIWLLDFWGRKDVAGIILMPLTRHQIGHLNDCDSLKKKINRLK